MVSTSTTSTMSASTATTTTSTTPTFFCHSLHWYHAQLYSHYHNCPYHHPMCCAQHHRPWNWCSTTLPTTELCSTSSLTTVQFHNSALTTTTNRTRLNIIIKLLRFTFATTTRHDCTVYPLTITILLILTMTSSSATSLTFCVSFSWTWHSFTPSFIVCAAGPSYCRDLYAAAWLLLLQLTIFHKIRMLSLAHFTTCLSSESLSSSCQSSLDPSLEVRKLFVLAQR